MLGRLEAQIGELTGDKVDIVPADGPRPHIADTALEEAVAL